MVYLSQGPFFLSSLYFSCLIWRYLSSSCCSIWITWIFIISLETLEFMLKFCGWWIFFFANMFLWDNRVYHKMLSLFFSKSIIDASLWLEGRFKSNVQETKSSLFSEKKALELFGYSWDSFQIIILEVDFCNSDLRICELLPDGIITGWNSCWL